MENPADQTLARSFKTASKFCCYGSRQLATSWSHLVAYVAQGLNERQMKIRVAPLNTCTTP